MNFVLAIMIIIIGPVLMMANETPDCRILDDTPLHSIRVDLTQEEKEQLEVEGQCFLACAVKVYKIDKVPAYSPKRLSILSLSSYPCIPLFSTYLALNSTFTLQFK